MLERRSSLVLPVLCILALATGPQQASAAFIQQKFFVVQKPAVRLQQLTNFVDPSSRFPKSNKALKWLKRHLNSILQSVSLIFRNTIALQTSTELTYLETRLISQTLVSAAFPDSFSLDTRWREAHPIIVDFDKDGDSDWVAVAYNDTHTQIFWVPNNGQGGFSAPVRIGPPTQGTEGRFSSDVAPSTFAVGDLDRDGFYDVVVRNLIETRIKYLVRRSLTLFTNRCFKGLPHERIISCYGTRIEEITSILMQHHFSTEFVTSRHSTASLVLTQSHILFRFPSTMELFLGLLISMFRSFIYFKLLHIFLRSSLGVGLTGITLSVSLSATLTQMET